MAQSLVKSSSLIRIQLQKRIEEQNLSLTKVSADAEERGRKISISSLSRYFKNSKVNNLSEESIIWLSYRYGIFVTLHIGTLVMSNGKASFHVPEYNEERCLIILKKVFPDVIKKSRKRILAKG